MFTHDKTPMVKVMSLALMLMVAASFAVAGTKKAPSTEEQMTGLQSMCDGSAGDRSARHAQEALYNRLGGYDRILELTTEIVRLHKVNPEIKHMFDHVDSKMLAKHVADFMAAGTGGTATYTGRDLPSSHAHLRMTDGDFLSAGGDVIQAMKNLDYGQDEIDEVVCILVSLKDQVVFN